MLKLHSLRRYMSMMHFAHGGGFPLATSSMKSGAIDLNLLVVFNAVMQLTCTQEPLQGPW